MVRKAVREDIEEILALLEPYVKKGIVLRRTAEEISSQLDLFYVSDLDSRIAGVVSYYRYSDSLMEIRSLAVREDLYDRKIGSEMVRTVVAELRAQNAESKIFALTLTPAFFAKCGFVVVEKETFPEKIWKDCVNCIKQDCCDEVPVVYAG